NVLEHTYGAEYGKRAGGQVSIVTSSGTNQLHGSLFEFLRNSALDTRGALEAAKGPFKRNQFGGALGGPLKKDKLFLFGTYEEFRERLARAYDSFVPDALARRGLLPGGSRVPGLKPRMRDYAKYFWPAPNGPSIGNGIAHSFNNPAQSINEHFGLVR